MFEEYTPPAKTQKLESADAARDAELGLTAGVFSVLCVASYVLSSPSAFSGCSSATVFARENGRNVFLECNLCTAISAAEGIHQLAGAAENRSVSSTSTQRPPTDKPEGVKTKRKSICLLLRCSRQS